MSTLLVLSLPLSGCLRVQEPNEIQEDSPVDIRRTGDGYLISQGGDSVLLYRDKPVHPDRPQARAHYVHPLFGLGGEVLTEDFPDDHLHHHGIFWAWHQIFQGSRRLGDGWIQEGISWDVRDVDILAVDSSAVLRTHVLWTSISEEDGRTEPFIEEITTISVYPSAILNSFRYRPIDFAIELTALADGVRIGGSEDEKGYGGFSIRLRLPEDVRFAGRDGPVEPHVNAVHAGPWLDISGTFGDSSAREDSSSATSDEPTYTAPQSEADPSSPVLQFAVAILQHPSNPDFPQSWILRREDSMQNVKWPGEEPAMLPNGEPVILRYRLLVHEGRWDAESLGSLFERYAAF